MHEYTGNQNNENEIFLAHHEFSCMIFFRFSFGYFFKSCLCCLFVAMSELNRKPSKFLGDWSIFKEKFSFSRSFKCLWNDIWIPALFKEFNNQQKPLSYLQPLVFQSLDWNSLLFPDVTEYQALHFHCTVTLALWTIFCHLRNRLALLKEPYKSGGITFIWYSHFFP